MIIREIFCLFGLGSVLCLCGCGSLSENEQHKKSPDVSYFNASEWEKMTFKTSEKKSKQPVLGKPIRIYSSDIVKTSEFDATTTSVNIERPFKIHDSLHSNGTIIQSTITGISREVESNELSASERRIQNFENFRFLN